MPLTETGEKIMKAMKAEYGDEEGERVFYASKAKGTILGVDSRNDAFGSKSYEGMANREITATENFISLIMSSGGLTRPQAEKAFKALKDAKALDFKDMRVNGVIKVKHGAYWERDVLRRAAGVQDSADSLLSRLDTMTEQVNFLGNAAAAAMKRVDASSPITITFQGRKYWSTGKTGKRFSNGAEVAEYQEIDTKGNATGRRAWREVKSGEVYPD